MDGSTWISVAHVRNEYLVADAVHFDAQHAQDLHGARRHRAADAVAEATDLRPEAARWVLKFIVEETVFFLLLKWRRRWFVLVIMNYERKSKRQSRASPPPLGLLIWAATRHKLNINKLLVLYFCTIQIPHLIPDISKGSQSH